MACWGSKKSFSIFSQGFWPDRFNNTAFQLSDQTGIIRDVLLSVTRIDLNTLKVERTQQPTDATYVMVYQMGNSTSLHTVYMKDIIEVRTRRHNFELAEVINSIPGGAPFIRLDDPQNVFYRVTCAIV